MRNGYTFARLTVYIDIYLARSDVPTCVQIFDKQAQARETLEDVLRLKVDLEKKDAADAEAKTKTVTDLLLSERCTAMWN